MEKRKNGEKKNRGKEEKKKRETLGKADWCLLTCLVGALANLPYNFDFSEVGTSSSI